MAAENVGLALEYFTKAVDRLPRQHLPWAADNDHAYYLESLAAALYRARRPEDALTVYRRMAELTAGRLRFGDLYARSYYMRGKIDESAGEAGAAARGFRRFLAIWGNSDPGLSEVDDARRRVAALQ